MTWVVFSVKVALKLVSVVQNLKQFVFMKILQDLTELMFNNHTTADRDVKVKKLFLVLKKRIKCIWCLNILEK